MNYLDCLLLGQAKAESMKFLPHGSLLEGYNEPCLVNIWFTLSFEYDFSFKAGNPGWEISFFKILP